MITLKNILVATDFSEAADAALTYGRALARTFGATLHVVHVSTDLYVPMGGDAYVAVLPELQREVESEARRRLDELLIDNDPVPVPAQSVIVSDTAPAPAIVDCATKLNADLVVLGTHGRGGVAHFFIGSVAENVVRSAPCPVLVVRHPERDFVTSDVPAKTVGG
jgi:nucleotide-binding universal stress UspA family protein